MGIMTGFINKHHGMVKCMSNGQRTYSTVYTILFFVLVAGSVFIVSASSPDLFETLRRYWTLVVGSLLLGIYAICKFLDKNNSLVNHESLLKSIVLVGALECIYALLQIIKVLPSYDRYFNYTGSFQNPAELALLLSVCVTVSAWMAFRYENKWFWITVAVGMFVFTLFSESRTGILSAIVATAIVCVKESYSIRKFVSNKYIIAIIILSFALLLSCLYLFKADSANGRLLIWRVTLSMLHDKPLFGWGSNGFGAMYMSYQAHYLSDHADSSFMLLASNPSNPFNEFIALMVNYGIFGLITVLAIVVMVLIGLFKSESKHKSLLIGLFFCLFVWGMFSYPSNIPFVWIVVAYIFLCSFVKRTSTGTYSFLFIAVISLVSFIFAIVSFIPEYKWKVISEKSIDGQCEEMLPYFEELSAQLSDNGLFMYNWAAELHYAHRYEESAKVFNSSLHLINDYDVQMLLADDYQHMGNTSLAVSHYDMASDMVPSKFLPHYYKMKLYLEVGDSISAVGVAEYIIKKEVKVKRSRSVQKIIEEAVALRDTYNKIN